MMRFGLLASGVLGSAAWASLAGDCWAGAGCWGLRPVRSIRLVIYLFIYSFYIFVFLNGYRGKLAFYAIRRFHACRSSVTAFPEEPCSPRAYGISLQSSWLEQNLFTSSRTPCLIYLIPFWFVFVNPLARLDYFFSPILTFYSCVVLLSWSCCTSRKIRFLLIWNMIAVGWTSLVVINLQFSWQ